MQASNGDDKNEPLLKFDHLLVIVGGGGVDLALLKQLRSDGVAIVAADGGAQNCQRAEIVPDMIVGDMDSLAQREMWEKRTRVLEIAEQDSTDFEKCLYATESQLTLVLGVTGKRLDHTLSALDVMARHAEKRNILIVDEEDVVLAKISKFCFTVDAGARVSIHPVMPISFQRSKGLDYALDDIKLVPAKQTGTSNRATNGAFEIVPEPGNQSPYLVMMDKKYLPDLISRLASDVVE